MPRPTRKNLMDFLRCEPEQAQAMAAVIKAAEDMADRRLRSAYEDIQNALEFVDKTIAAHGIETIRGERASDSYYGDFVALYVNTGDSYNGTVLFDIVRRKFEVTTLGDFVEKYDRRYRII